MRTPLLAAVLAAASALAQQNAAVQVVRRYPAEQATQGVAVDGTSFYAIASAAIGKYDLSTGRRTALWQETAGGRIGHLNSGVVIGSELHCAHSNYPETPMVSSIEVFDTRTLAHLRSVPLPSGLGSATWVDRRRGDWWIAFAHYAGKGGEPGKGPEATRLVRFDQSWRQKGSWSFPPEVVARWDGMSSSGGVWVGDRRLVTTGHHAPELYILDLPARGSQLSLHRILPVESEGQGIAWDRRSRLLYSIQRRTREVLAAKLAL